MRKFLYIFLIFIVVNAFAQQKTTVTSQDNTVTLDAGIGVNYNFNFSFDSDIFSRSDIVFLDIPLSIGVDIRRNPYASFYTGLEIIYAYHLYKNLGHEIHNHNLYFRIPLMVKLYPLAIKDPKYWNFYVITGALLHFWAVNAYALEVDNTFEGGIQYAPDHDCLPPGNIYTPANIGIKLGVGNSFPVAERVFLGLELYTTFYVIPFRNAYYFNENYIDYNGTIMINSMANVGLKFYAAFELNRHSAIYE